MTSALSKATIALPDNVVHVPTVKQVTNFSCGPAAALSVLRYWRADSYARVDEASLYDAMDTTPAKGTEPEPITDYLKRAAGLDATYVHGDVTLAQLERAVDDGAPPIVDLQAWRDTQHPWREVWDAGHYAVLVGYDAEHLFFMDPSVLTHGPYAYMPRAELDERWHDLAGPRDERVYRMTIFVRGSGPRWTPGPDAYATAVPLG
jgi:predicted double-glycine peptidase